MVEAILRHYLNSRWRRETVIILSLLLVLLTVWPAVDQYSELRTQQVALEADWQTIGHTVAQMERLQQQAKSSREQLKPLEAACVGPAQLAVFRGHVVELARASGCQIRRMNVGDTQRKEWLDGDAANPSAAEQAPSIKHLVHTQGVSIWVTGRLASTRDFLKRFLALDMLVQNKRMTLRATEGNHTEVALELECLLFDLIEGPQNPR
jgi:hypothetical protein